MLAFAHDVPGIYKVQFREVNWVFILNISFTIYYLRSIAMSGEDKKNNLLSSRGPFPQAVPTRSSKRSEFRVYYQMSRVPLTVNANRAIFALTLGRLASCWVPHNKPTFCHILAAGWKRCDHENLRGWHAGERRGHINCVGVWDVGFWSKGEE